MEQRNNSSFVMYESVFKQMERLEKKMGKEITYDYIRAVMEFGLYGVIPGEDSDLWLYGLEQTFTSINAAQVRRAKNMKDGKTGGKKTTIDYNKVISLKLQGKTLTEIATACDCSERSVSRIWKEHTAMTETLTDTDRQEIKTTTEGKDSQNLNVNVNDNVNDNNNNGAGVVGSAATTSRIWF